MASYGPLKIAKEATWPGWAGGLSLCQAKNVGMQIARGFHILKVV